MKSRKYPTFQEAIKDLESKGTLTYWGWEGQKDGYYVYSFVAQTGIPYELAVYKNGWVRIRE